MGTVYNGIMGLVVGDALGVPFEFRQRGTYKATDMVGFGTHQQPPGTWSDDSSLTLATLESIVRRGGVDPADIMQNFFFWLDDGMFTPYGKVFDIGGATKQAIYRYANGEEPAKCGAKSRLDNGNGALMRILPLAFVDHTAKDVEQVGQLTHAHEISQTACRLYVHLAHLLLNGMPLKNAICVLAYLPPVAHMKEFGRISYIGELRRKEIRSTGYVVDTLEAALWCFVNSSTYEDCVLTAVNLGDDTDTIAAIAGSLAGIYYGCGGETGIPDRWIQQIARREWIEQLCNDFEKLISK